jgi:hypothetical protein
MFMDWVNMFLNWVGIDFLDSDPKQRIKLNNLWLIKNKINKNNNMYNISEILAKY